MNQLMLREKTCSNCDATLICGDTLSVSCWCNQYPPIFELDSNNDCLCKSCLHQKSLIKIQEYIVQIKRKGVKYNIAPKLTNNSSLIEELDYYIENGLFVFTEWYHLKRGYCCNNNCRHCPFRV